MGFYGTLKMIFYKMKRKLDHGPEVRSFPSGKKPCKGPEYPSPTGLVPYPATPTTFGDLRAANGQGQQRRRITSIQPPAGLQEWLRTFQSWSGPEKLLALDELIDSCEPTQVKHMMQVIEPQFQRDFISLLPKELALYVLSFLEPKDLLQAAQTCRNWRYLAEDNLLWREKCKEEGIDEPLPPKRRKPLKPGFTHSPWKSAYIRQHRIDTNWRRGDLKSPKFCGARIVRCSNDNTPKSGRPAFSSAAHLRRLPTTAQILVGRDGQQPPFLTLSPRIDHLRYRSRQLGVDSRVFIGGSRFRAVVPAARLSPW
ncbi:hypothetical protein ANANG_G00098560 [Anguilla anguilla]|uniref:F-box domain-containing protein n=1 Tax=Anguilla anguilla TaxID=7936 RepID=A0A9D3MIW6_ANGAN|nr:hypothetical protein ANANG_G00098560 [Anguilla anguilla]